MEKIQDQDGAIIYAKQARIVLGMLVVFPAIAWFNSYMDGSALVYVGLVFFAGILLWVGGHSERITIHRVSGTVVHSTSFFSKSLHSKSIPFTHVTSVGIIELTTRDNPSATYLLTIEWRDDSGRGSASLCRLADKAAAKQEATRLASIMSTRLSSALGSV